MAGVAEHRIRLTASEHDHLGAFKAMPVEVRLRLTPGDEKTVHLVDLGEVDRGRGGALFERVEGLARSGLDDVR